VKPVESSGSEGIRRIADPEVFDIFLRGNKTNLTGWVIQEYLEGPSYSLEVIGLSGRCITLQPTLLEMDATFDCKRVVAPADLSTALDQEFKAIGSTLAQTLDLNGVMDLEVILHEGRLKILEIDARLPSQTPTAVEKSTGINMLELLREIFVEARLPEVSLAEPPRGVVYEHLRVQEDRVEVLGEHIMVQTGPLHMEHDFFGADTALTNFSAPDRPWVATLVVSAPNREQAWERRDEVIRAIMETCNLSTFMDRGPDRGHRMRRRRGDPSRT